MKIDIIDEKYNPFMKRKELVINIETPEESTPARAQLIELLTKHIDKQADYIEVTKILSSHGLPKAKAWIFVWDEKRLKEEKKEEAKTESAAETTEKAAAQA